LAVSQNNALFSLLGTIYGGDGRTTFALPDLRGRLPMHAGSGPGLSRRGLGARLGSESVTLTAAELPSHSHTYSGTNDDALRTVPTDSFPARSVSDLYKAGNAVRVSMSSQSLLPAGGSTSHTNLMPFLCVNFIIALFGVYPSRN
jgi:microcystin-dependent protein